MNCLSPLPAESLLQRETRVFLPALVDEIDGAVRPSAPHQSGNGIDCETEAIFPLLEVDVEVSQSQGRIVEYSAQVSQFILAGNRHLILKITSRQRFRALHQSFQWLGD